MKKLFSLSAAVVLFGMLFLASCAKEEEPEPTDPGNTDPRARFYGFWSVDETSKDYGPQTYNVTISDSTNSTHILLAYLYGLSKKTHATVSGNNLTIAAQQIDGLEVSGNGTLLNANHLKINYLVKYSTTHYDTVTASLKK